MKPRLLSVLQTDPLPACCELVVLTTSHTSERGLPSLGRLVDCESLPGRQLHTGLQVIANPFDHMVPEQRGEGLQSLEKAQCLSAGLRRQSSAHLDFNYLWVSLSDRIDRC